MTKLKGAKRGGETAGHDQPKIKVDDVITWGRKVYAHRVVAVNKSGVYVDASFAGFMDPYFVSYGEPGFCKTEMPPGAVKR